MQNIRNFLSGVKFPASKQELLKFAQEHHAPEDVMSSLQKIGDRKYNDVSEVARETIL
jgi:hypothetical protein